MGNTDDQRTLQRVRNVSDWFRDRAITASEALALLQAVREDLQSPDADWFKRFDEHFEQVRELLAHEHRGNPIQGDEYLRARMATALNAISVLACELQDHNGE